MGKQSYLGFRKLAWSLVAEEASARDVGQDVLTRMAETVGVMLSRHWWGGSGVILPAVPDAGLASGEWP